MITIIKNPAGQASDKLEDWGPVVQPVGDVIAKLRGVMVTDSDAGEPESGIWECTPGKWHRQVKKAEFCHFLSGHCTFTSTAGQKIEIAGGDTVYFPANSLGIWDVQETVRKVYILLG
ncbi:MAG TPA: cupin domain-containing protein [Terriglobales bacterium]|nr:cupin domain-containing protein [Terriglobales bacterium]